MKCQRTSQIPYPKKLFVGSVFSGQLGLSNPDPPQINVYLMILRAWIAMNQLSAALHAGRSAVARYQAPLSEAGSQQS